MKQCVLQENNLCSACGECNRCDLDSSKLCDNCCSCIAKKEDAGEDLPGYAHISVADIVQEDFEAYLSEYYAAEEESDASLPFYEKPDPALLSYWEERLKDLDTQEPVFRGVRKRRDR